MRFRFVRPRHPTTTLILCAALFTSLAHIDRARACAGGFSTAESDVGADAQIALYALKASTTELVVLVNVPSAENDFGMVMPVPAGTTLSSTPVDADGLATLEQETRPRITVYEGEADGGGIPGCLTPRSGNDLGDAEGADGVTVSTPVDIGPLTAVVITGDTGNAIADWLTANSFLVPAGAQDIVDGYVNAGSHLVAFKRNDTATSEAVSLGVHMTIPGDHRGFALRMVSIGAPEEVAITLFVAHASENIGPAAPFSANDLTALDGQAIVDDGYRAAVRAYVDANDGRAFIHESSRSFDTYDAFGLAGIVDDGSVLTRLTTVMARADMTEDLALTEVIDAADGSLEIDLASSDDGALAFLSSVIRDGARALTSLAPLLALFLVLLVRVVRARRRAASLTVHDRHAPAVRASRWASMAPRHSRDAQAARRRARGASSENAARPAPQRLHRRENPRTRRHRAHSR
jgi:hypothetical protein